MTDSTLESIRRHRNTALTIARGFYRKLPKSVLIEDIEQAALIGLWEWKRNHQDEAVEGWLSGLKVRIRGAIQDELRRQDWLPRYTRRDHGYLRVVGLDDVDDMWDAHMAAPGSTGEASLEVRQEFDRAMQAPLTARDAKVIDLHYARGMKFKDIGAQLGVSEPRVCQLHSRAIGKMRDQLEGNEQGLAAARRQLARSELRAPKETHMDEEQPSGIYQASAAAVTATLPDEGLDLRGELARYQDWMVEQALIRSNGNRSKAARMLRIERTTLVMMLKSKGPLRPKLKPLAKCGPREAL